MHDFGRNAPREREGMSREKISVEKSQSSSPAHAGDPVFQRNR
jgi:hypothetical protein